MLDLFAGTGALGLEALSRGAVSAVFVDSQRTVGELIGKNIALCGFSDRAMVFNKDLTRGLAFLTAIQPSIKFELIFLDPPYEGSFVLRTLESLAGGSFLAAKAIVVVEDAVAAQHPEIVGPLACFDKRRYGDAGFWLYQHNKAGCND